MATHQQVEERVNKGFWIQLGCYILAIMGLAVLNYQRNPDNLWVLWVAGGWGIGIIAHAVAFVAKRGRMIDRTQARLNRREEMQERRDSRHESHE